MYYTKSLPIFTILGKPLRFKRIRHTNAQTEEYENGEVLWSYGTLVAIHTYGNDPRYNWWFTKYHDYSITTSKHVKEFSGFSAKERRKGLKDGKFALIDD